MSTNGNGKQTQHGIRGISIGLPENQKDYLFYSPASWQIYISGDITVNEGFTSIIATTWHLQRDTLALRPAASNIPMVTTTLEYTGDITNTLSPSDPTDVEEGEIIAHADETQTEDEDDASPPLVHNNTDVAPPSHDELTMIARTLSIAKTMIVCLRRTQMMTTTLTLMMKNWMTTLFSP